MIENVNQEGGRTVDHVDLHCHLVTIEKIVPVIWENAHIITKEFINDQNKFLTWGDVKERIFQLKEGDLCFIQICGDTKYIADIIRYERKS